MQWFSVALAVAATTAGAADPCRDGSAALSRSDLPSAEKLLKQCVQTQPAQLESFLDLAAVYQVQANSEALLDLALRGIRRFPSEKRFYLTAGTHLGRAKRFHQAVQVLEGGMRRFPGDAKIRLLLASSHFGRGAELSDSAQYEKALEHLRRAVELDPADVEALVNLGRVQHNLHRNTEALATFNRALAANPALPLGRFHRAMSHQALGQFDLAVEDLNREIAANPGYPPSYLVRGSVYLSLGEWEKALADLEIAASRMPDHAPAQYNRARALIQLGNLKEAEAGLRKTIVLDPGDAGPLNALIALLLRLGRDGEAAALRPKAAELARKSRGTP